MPYVAPGRKDQIKRLKEEEFDVLVIGGGATGAGVALDAASRGLKTALVERADFSAGTSGRSTKLIHGGIRYLERAFWRLDYTSLELVHEALEERAFMLRAAPYMNSALPIMIPIYEAWQVPYFWAGAKAYDLVAWASGGGGAVPPSRFVDRSEALLLFPMLREEGLKGAIVYYDGQMNDARLCLTVALTAAQQGAAVCNRVRVTGLLKAGDAEESRRSSTGENCENCEKSGGSEKSETGGGKNRVSPPGESESKMPGGQAPPPPAGESPAGSPAPPPPEAPGQVRGAVVEDLESGQRFAVRARSVVNATGPFSDAVRRMDDAGAAPLIVPAGGVHLVLPRAYSPEGMGLIVPKTRDGRVLFLLPWEGGTVCGTTDSITPITMAPRPSEEEAAFILAEARRYLATEVGREDVKAAWSGIRPLVRDPQRLREGTGALSRKHLVLRSESGLISVIGGKWTTYRRMAQDAVDAACAVLSADPPCRTRDLRLLGSDTGGAVCAGDFAALAEQLERGALRMPKDVARHLVRNYGTRALQVAQVAAANRHGVAPGGAARRLSPGHPFLEAEVVFAAEQEYATCAVDVIARRTRLAFVDAEAAERCAPRVVEIMAAVGGWGRERRGRELEAVRDFLQTMRDPKTREAGGGRRGD